MSNTVALESTVIAHGLPYPKNYETAKNMERAVLENGGIPKTIGIIDGQIIIGLDDKNIKFLATGKNIYKLGTAEIPVATALKLNGATTVSGTMSIASKNNIDIFATGGIGGVHRDVSWDVSQDISELSKTNMIVVSSGFKSILDVQKTIEFLETFQITVLGYKTDSYPLFHSRKSEYKIPFRVNSPEEIISVFEEKRKLGISGAVLVFNPVPEEDEIPYKELDSYIQKAVEKAKEKNINGKALTPFLLSYLSEISDGKTLETNISLLLSNAKLAGKIAGLRK
jgi:pseudouridine-5'-phosphate glycosidase